MYCIHTFYLRIGHLLRRPRRSLAADSCLPGILVYIHITYTYVLYTSRIPARYKRITHTYIHVSYCIYTLCYIRITYHIPAYIRITYTYVLHTAHVPQITYVLYNTYVLGVVPRRPSRLRTMCSYQQGINVLHIRSCFILIYIPHITYVLPITFVLGASLNDPQLRVQRILTYQVY